VTHKTLWEEIFTDIRHCEAFCSVIGTCMPDGGRVGDWVVCAWPPHLLMMYGKQLSRKSYHVDVSHKAQGVTMKHEPAIHCTSYPTRGAAASWRPRKDLKHRYTQDSVRSGIIAYHRVSRLYM